MARAGTLSAVPCSERNSVSLIFSSEEFSASEEVFASTAELCSDNFLCFPHYGTMGLLSPFVVLCTC